MPSNFICSAISVGNGSNWRINYINAANLVCITRYLQLDRIKKTQY